MVARGRKVAAGWPVRALDARTASAAAGQGKTTTYPDVQMTSATPGRAAGPARAPQHV